ncbi:hypothetical protein EV182_004780 [Spiromyces aspiralis]|uniref:Uncharacterized protein n=1 Tax=Spiromyces aspiralis TaxID=68401 RepID=A0ACC1HIE0_9FUNG|nr:hypothetical protein EV182_004780 [Spiromyces aspiralis]
MSCPNISTVLDGAAPVMVSPRTSVREVASLMRAHRTTASLVMESSGDRIAGIFTSKDLVLRVVAAGLDPSTCSVVRVMTPHPDTVSPDISIIDALKRMYERHYLNLPVLSADNEILGVVDVLRLCYATLEQMKTIQRNKQAEDGQGANGNSSELGESGPMWSRFFNGTLPAEFENRSEVGRNSHAGYSVGPPGSYLESSPFSPEIYPNESASMVEDIRSAVNSRVGEQETFPLAMSPMQAVAQGGLGAMSMPLPPTDSHIGCHSHSATAAQSQITVGGPSAPPPNVPEGHYTFKFKSPAGKTHRFTSPKDDIDDLRNAVVRLMTQDGVEDAQEMLDKVGIAYLDEDDDTVSLSTSKDLEHAVQVASQLGKHRVFIQFNPQGLAEHQAKKRLAREEELKKKREDDEAEMARKAVIAAKEALRGISVGKADEEATGPLGIPEKYLVPTALGGGFLAALLVVFIATKVAKS